MKKNVALSILLIANMVLLAHEFTEFNESSGKEAVCASDSEDIDYVDDDYTPFHSQKSAFDILAKCNYGQLFSTLPPNTLNLKDYDDIFFVYVLFQSIIVDYHSTYTPQSHGLRAPPVC